VRALPTTSALRTSHSSVAPRRQAQRRQAARWRSRVTPRGPRRRNASQPAPLAGLAVLDVGCGGGLLAEALARLGADVTGADASAESIGVARAHAAADPALAVAYRAATAEQLVAEGARAWSGPSCLARTLGRARLALSWPAPACWMPLVRRQGRSQLRLPKHCAHQPALACDQAGSEQSCIRTECLGLQLRRRPASATQYHSRAAIARQPADWALVAAQARSSTRWWPPR